MAEPLLVVDKLNKHFPPAAFSRGSVVKALQDISFTVPRGQVVGLVGESGSGKTTIGRSVLRLIEPTSGAVNFDGVDLTKLPPAEMRKARRRMQYIFQDPFASLSPRMTIGVSALRAHLPCNPSLSSPTSRSRRWTSRCRRKSSI